MDYRMLRLLPEMEGFSGDISVRVQPRARSNEIVGDRDGVLLVRVSAPPVEGKANEALCKVIARSLGIARGRVAIVRGVGSRQKLVRVQGFSSDYLRKALLDQSGGSKRGK
jgi:uncharacterized protein (TIGR00251 family)